MTKNSFNGTRENEEMMMMKRRANLSRRATHALALALDATPGAVAAFDCALEFLV